MRKVLLVVISLLLLADLAGTGLVVSSGRGTLSSELASFGLSSGRAWFSIGSLSFGEIGEKGMVKTFSNPHGVNLSLRPYVTRPGNGEGWNGFVLDYERMGIIFSVDERPLAGISFSGEWVEAAMMAVYGDGGGRGFHDDAGESQEFTTVYAGFDLSPGAFRLTALMSYAAEVGSRSFLSAGFSIDDYSFSVSIGSLIALQDSFSPVFGIRGSFGEQGYLFMFSFSSGDVPVFSDDYRRKDAYALSLLEFGDIEFRSEMETAFTRRGKRVHRERFSFSWKQVEAGYDTEEGIFIILRAGDFTAGYENGIPFIGFSPSVSGDSFSIRMMIGGDGSFDLHLRADL